MILNENGGLRMSDLGYQMFVVEKKIPTEENLEDAPKWRQSMVKSMYAVLDFLKQSNRILTTESN